MLALKEWLVRLIVRFNISNSFLSMPSVGESEADISNIPLIILLFFEDLYPLTLEELKNISTISGRAIARR
jgi:hypothetical protein